MGVDVSGRTEADARASQDLDLVRRTLAGDRAAVEEWLERLGCVRRFLTELKARSEMTGAQIAGRRGLRSTRTGAMAKRAKDKLPAKAGSRNERDRAQSSAQRGRAQKETQR